MPDKQQGKSKQTNKHARKQKLTKKNRTGKTQMETCRM
jgi:hypothetical protein